MDILLIIVCICICIFIIVTVVTIILIIINLKIRNPKLKINESDNVYTVNIWEGRIGNNLIQLTDVLLIAKKQKGIAIFPKHYWLNTFPISFEKEKDGIRIKEENFIGDIKKIGWHSRKIFPTWRERSDLLKLFGKQLFKNYAPKQLIKSDTLVIHIRSGDIFDNYIHKLYWQPPLSMYIKIIDEKKPSKILIISDSSKNNPCIQKLENLYKGKIRIQSKSLEEDINTILAAETIITSRSTFIISLALMSENLKTIYLMQSCNDPNDYFCEILNSKIENYPESWKEIWKCTFSNYISEWKNTKKQIKIMLQYPKEHVIIKKIQ